MLTRYFFILPLILGFFIFPATKTSFAQHEISRKNIDLVIEYIDKYKKAKTEATLHKKIMDINTSIARTDKKAASKYHKANRQYIYYTNEQNKHARFLSSIIPQITEHDLNVASNTELRKLKDFYIEISKHVHAEQIKNILISRSIKDAKEAGTKPKAPEMPKTKGPFFKDLPKETEVHVLSVRHSANYNPMSKELRTGNRMGHIIVDVENETKPIFLVLTAYEPVDWYINAKQKDTNLVGILLSGMYEQRALNVPPGVPSINWSKVKGQEAYYFYSSKEPENRLYKHVVMATHKRIRSIQEEDEAERFIIR